MSSNVIRWPFWKETKCCRCHDCNYEFDFEALHYRHSQIWNLLFFFRFHFHRLRLRWFGDCTGKNRYERLVSLDVTRKEIINIEAAWACRSRRCAAIEWFRWNRRLARIQSVALSKLWRNFRILSQHVWEIKEMNWDKRYSDGYSVRNGPDWLTSIRPSAYAADNRSNVYSDFFYMGMGLLNDFKISEASGDSVVPVSLAYVLIVMIWVRGFSHGKTHHYVLIIASDSTNFVAILKRRKFDF